MFRPDPAFAAGSQALAELGLCHVRLQDDARWPWLILIPRIDGARELEDLEAPQRAALMEEAVLAGAAVRAMGEAAGRAVFKLNLAALGNVTPQLHVHVVGRRTDDAAWPGPVWGVTGAGPYDDSGRARARQAALAILAP
ncbi:HIT domain-containing protein [Caulobacter sp. KR2-114]|uniref:HIT domain-containing protein n=1 Tax=Caulobacter sp. KR2-114 TaxID=3400912 RepID=UPI003C03F838